jgi:DNA-binding transcriptional LysR family regulator
MDFDQLNTFLEVARLGSFSRAADKVFRSQPAVSAQIRQLEEEYGQKLFDRTRKWVRLTPAGEVLRAYAEQFVKMREKSRLAVADLKKTPTGTLAIGANEATFLYVLPKIFEKFHKQYPQVKISVYRNFSYKVVNKVEEGAIDVGVVTYPVNSPALTEAPIFKDKVLLMVGKNCPLFKKRSATLAEIAEQPLVLPRTGSMRRLMEKRLTPLKNDLNITMELTSVVMIKRFVAAGFGVSFISASYARENVRRGEVKLLDIAGVDLWRTMGVIHRKNRTLPRAAAAFIEMLEHDGHHLR